MNIVNWQSALTEHQAHLLLALARLPGVNLKTVIFRGDTVARQTLSWEAPDLTNLDVTALSARNWLIEGVRLLRNNRNACHLFCGLWADRRLFVLLLFARISGCRVSLMSEPYSDVPSGLVNDQMRVTGTIKIWLRRLAYRLAGVMFGAAASPVFAISPKAVTQFKRAGFRQDTICPFGYFVPRHEGAPIRDRIGDDELRVVFVGGLLRRKGLDIASKAVRTAAAGGIKIRLDVYGPGCTADMNADDPCICFRGVIPFGHAQQVFCAYDVLLVPSRFDGWAVVVNEALLQGVPVLASDAVGSAAMLQKNGVGFVFASEQPQALAGILVDLARQPAMLAAARYNTLIFRDKLLPAIAAQYMYDCYASLSTRARMPTCPWF
jgi:glycosyltransferase involved in cell wall biosynthesis